MSPAMTNATITLTTEVESVIASLTDLLDRETEAVKAADFELFKTLQNDKVALMTRYRALAETLQNQGPQLKTAGDQIKDRLRGAATLLDTSLDRNRRALEAGTKSMQRIVDRIIHAARETINEGRTTYDKKGRNAGGTTLSIRLNEVL